MNSSFFEFHVASSALFTAKAALQVINHNIANQTTKGYSRQYVEQRASRPLATYNSKGMVGTGSEVYGIGQVRSFYLDKKYWSERAVLGEYSVKDSQITLMQSIFNELSKTGLSGHFDDFFNVLQDDTTNIPDATYRNNVVKSAESLASYINSTAASLRKQQLDANSELETLVTTINNIGQQIANLNQQISKYEIDGSQANDLRDQRALLIDQLSLYVNVEVQETEINDDYAAGKYPNPEDRGKSDKRLTVLINGYEFVNNWDCTSLKTVARSESNQRNAMDADGLYDIEFSNGISFNIYSSSLKGELKGIIDIRDGNNSANTDASGNPIQMHNYKGIPHYLNKLNQLVRVFATAFNTEHENGFDANGARGESFFTYKDAAGNDLTALTPADYAGMNCFNFKVNSSILLDPGMLACSDDPTSGESNNKTAFKIADIFKNQSLFKEGKLADFITGMTSELAVDGKQATNFTKNYTDVTTSIDSQRKQVSGVSDNEEILAMVQYQQQYQSAAKLISVINDLYDTIINKMGV